MTSTLRTRFEEEWAKVAGNTRLSLVQSDKILSFIASELELLAEEVLETVQGVHTHKPENCRQCEIVDAYKHAASIIREKIKEIKI